MWPDGGFAVRAGNNYCLTGSAADTIANRGLKDWYSDAENLGAQCKVIFSLWSMKNMLKLKIESKHKVEASWAWDGCARIALGKLAQHAHWRALSVKPGDGEHFHCPLGPVYGSRPLYVRTRRFWNCADVTLADDDTNSIRLMMPI